MLHSLQQNVRPRTPSATAMDINEEPEPEKDGDSLLSFDTDTQKDEDLHLDPSIASLLRVEGSHSDLEEGSVSFSEEDNTYDEDKHNEASPTTIPLTPPQTAPNSKTRRNLNLKRRTLGDEDSTVDTNRSTRTKTSLQISVQDKPSSSEEADNL